MMKSVKILIIFLFLSFITFSVFAEENKMTVKVGDNFKIELDSNPSTGYQWQIAKPLKNVKPVSTIYIPSNTKLVGASGKEVWTFKAIKAGKTCILFKYVRSWENNKPTVQKKYLIDIVS